MTDIKLVNTGKDHFKLVLPVAPKSYLAAVCHHLKTSFFTEGVIRGNEMAAVKQEYAASGDARQCAKRLSDLRR